MHRTTLAAALAITAPAFAQPFPSVSSVDTSGVLFDVNDTEADIIASGAPAVTFGDTTIYAGYQQVAANNQDPILVAYRDGARIWTNTQLEFGPVDARATGLLWDGKDRLYVGFRQIGFSFDDLRSFTAGGWQPSVVNAGSTSYAVILRIDPNTGLPVGQEGTFIVARLTSTNRANTCLVNAMGFCANGDIVASFDSFFNPLRTDLSIMNYTGTGSSPHDYRVRLTADLSTATNAEAIDFDNVTAFSTPLTECPFPPAVRTCEPADQNGDGFLDGLDASSLITDLIAADPTADYNADALLDVFDLLRLLRDIDAGC